MQDYKGRLRRKRPDQSQLAIAELDEAMRTVHSAAHAALKLVFMARHRLGMPPI